MARMILDHWEMRSIRNVINSARLIALYFRSLGNALYPELTAQSAWSMKHFRSLGNALYPELMIIS